MLKKNKSTCQDGDVENDWIRKLPEGPQRGIRSLNFKPVFRIRIRIHRIHMFLGLKDPAPDPLVRGMDPAPDPSIMKQK
jgi:hypothetical protein